MELPIRTRSKTIYSKPSPCRPIASPRASNTTIPAFTEIPVTDGSFSPSSPAGLFDVFGPITKCKTKDAFTGDYQALSPASQDCLSNASTAIDGIRSRCVSGVSCDELLEIDPKLSKFFRGMVIGPNNTENSAIINTLFPAMDNEEASLSNNCRKFDLVTRKIDKETSTERYHFWMKETGQTGRQYALLMDIYYKTCSTFFLVYNENDRNSFEALTHEINVIKEVNRSKEVLLVLVGNRSIGQKSEVKVEEAHHLKEKHGITAFIESGTLNDKSQELREAITSLLR